MKIDLYTKTVLTAIAIGLFWIGINTTAPASAGPDIMSVNIAEVAGSRLSPYAKALPVKIVQK